MSTSLWPRLAPVPRVVLIPRWPSGESAFHQLPNPSLACNDPGRSGCRGCPPAEGASATGVHRPDGPHTTGGPHRRSGRSVVRGNACSSTTWPRPRPRESPDQGRVRQVCTDGCTFWFAERPRLLLSPSWSTGG